ncbi:MAG: cell envelope integrity EipB family protein [Micavibrio aeruginosavorus]|uniref:Cell envelope integrity EipB family protein n=1 Tax=Micavibrio aeruginosavorus TaxID=349221 RepID=A0A7T5R3I6_9BACT|nr:MAG: cell envelope integrity EipB family protein [Micavibrio aeruginosavorus]
MRYNALKPALILLLLTAAPALAGERLDRTAREALAPHKAIYTIEMISRRSSSQILNIHGQMYFSLQPSCEAWSTDHRFNLYYEYADSAPMQITSDFTTYEPMDGKSFDFNSRRRRDGELYQELRGKAVRDDRDAATVTYSQPDGLTFDMPQGSLFPMAHTTEMMKNIRKGQRVFSAIVFDGSDEEGPIEINTVVGKAVNVMATLEPGPAIDTTLINSPARLVRMAFFPIANAQPEADYEMDVILHDNGVISDMTVDYGEFSVSQKLVALENIPAPSCDKKTPANGGKHDKSEPAKDKPKRKPFSLIP